MFLFWLLFLIPTSLYCSDFLKVSDYLNSMPESIRNEYEGVSLLREGTDLPSWMLANIEKEFRLFKSFSEEDIEKTFNEYPLFKPLSIINTKEKRCQHPEGLVHIRVRDKILYCRATCPLFDHPVPQIILVFTRLFNDPLVNIENGDFLVATWDTAYKHRSEHPILCFSKHYQSNYINIPDWFAFSRYRDKLMDKIDQTVSTIPWEAKIEKGNWIGAPNGILDNMKAINENNRMRLVFFSIKHPDLVWARFTFNSMKDRFWIHPDLVVLSPLLSIHQWISESESCKYKYLIDADGWGAAYHRCQWILRSNSVLIKENSGHTQWYYSGLKPYVHYVPYSTDCSDLEKVIHWVRTHDDEAKKIAVAAREFNLEYLNIEMDYLYLYHVLKSYNKLNKSVL